MFIQCYSCGDVFPVYEAHYESEIKDSLQTTDNPFESNESVFLSTESRREQRRKGKRKSRFKAGELEDPEIQAEIDKGNTVRIIQDT